MNGILVLHIYASIGTNIRIRQKAKLIDELELQIR